MIDQASHLRELKKLVLSQRDNLPPDPDTFLKGLARPCHFKAIILLTLDEMGHKLSPLQQWLPFFLEPTGKALVWDQAGILAAGSFFLDPPPDSFPSVQHIETPSVPFPAIPALAGFSNLVQREPPEKVRFLRYLERTFSSITEAWITLPYSLLAHSQALVHAADLVLIISPQHPEAPLKAYEAVKSLHLSGLFAPLGILAEPLPDAASSEPVFPRIQSVAKKFLGLDLQYGGMIPSFNHPPTKDTPCPARTLLTSIPSETQDFLFAFAERLFYPIPSDRPVNHD